MLIATPAIVGSADTAGLAAHQDDFRRAYMRVLEKPFDLEELLNLLGVMLP